MMCSHYSVLRCFVQYGTSGNPRSFGENSRACGIVKFCQIPDSGSITYPSNKANRKRTRANEWANSLIVVKAYMFAHPKTTVRSLANTLAITTLALFSRQAALRRVRKNQPQIRRVKPCGIGG